MSIFYGKIFRNKLKKVKILVSFFKELVQVIIVIRNDNTANTSKQSKIVVYYI